MTDDSPPGFPDGIDGSEVGFVSVLGYFMLMVARVLFFSPLKGKDGLKI